MFAFEFETLSLGRDARQAASVRRGEAQLCGAALHGRLCDLMPLKVPKEHMCILNKFFDMHTVLLATIHTFGFDILYQNYIYLHRFRQLSGYVAAVRAGGARLGELYQSQRNDLTLAIKARREGRA